MKFSSQLGRAKGAIGASLLILIALGCDEDGKTAPEKCGTPPLQIYDIQDPPADDDSADNPCVTPIGHAVSPAGELGGSTANGGSSVNGGAPSDAGAGGAPDTAQAGAGGA
jgi:hypothetical protein